MKKYLSIICFIFFLACEENVEPKQAPQQDSLELSQPISVDTNRKVSLLEDANVAVSEWLAYAMAQNEVENLRSQTGKEIILNAEPLLEIMENLNSTIPVPLQTQAVRARTNVLYTKAGILHQLSNKKNENADEIFNAANELIIEFDNFKIQLNELYLKAPEDFELELDRQLEENQQQGNFPPDTLDEPQGSLR
ncbi:hypothetical protein [Salinimicrobium sp. GXAS 041]|uniref:hypothetical protein n=1 Tax=Salinimicrobium sp. GXAS 041 TaxID=3400806 RepID=UPI003C717523